MDGMSKAIEGIKGLLISLGKLIAIICIAAVALAIGLGIYHRFNPPECIDEHGQIYCLKKAG